MNLKVSAKYLTIKKQQMTKEAIFLTPNHW